MTPCHDFPPYVVPPITTTNCFGGMIVDVTCDGDPLATFHRYNPSEDSLWSVPVEPRRIDMTFPVKRCYTDALTRLLTDVMGTDYLIVIDEIVPTELILMLNIVNDIHLTSVDVDWMKDGEPIQVRIRGIKR